MPWRLHMDFKRSFLQFQGKRIFPRSFPESTGLPAALTKHSVEASHGFSKKLSPIPGRRR
jgi:hypothetical protein